MIDSFGGKYRFLSNFYTAEVVFEGRVYPSTEHAFQAAKTLDLAERAIIAAEPSPGRAKRLGRGVSLRSDWEDIKIDVMRAVVRDKFSRHPYLAAKLLETGDQMLVEGNRWGDRFWGVTPKGGKNWLGRILMEVRDELSA
jgi:N-glycosidase YbiA